MKVSAVLLLVLAQGARSEECPESCRCTKYKIFCKYTNLKSLPQGCSSTTFLSMEADFLMNLNQTVVSKSGLKNLTTLKLVNMRIRVIQAFTFNATKELNHLTITGNEITDLQTGAFLGLEKLNALDLSRNKIRNISSGVFEGLRILRHLNLRSNYISYIQFGFFGGLGRVYSSKQSMAPSILDLSDNKIFGIDDQAFLGLSFFTQIEIELCEAISLDLDYFKGLISLQTITISGSFYCNNTSIIGGMFRGFYNLTYLIILNVYFPVIHNRLLEDFRLLKILRIDYSYVQELEPHCFHALQSLSELYLVGNNLKNLTTGAFENLQSLSVLDLSHNQIGNLSIGVLQGLISLQKLDLTANQIEIIEENFFLDLSRLKFLYLNNNPLKLIKRNAFCQLHFLKELDLILDNESHQIKFFHSDAFTCLFSLKRLRLSHSFHLISTTVTLDSLQRLDSFEGPAQLSAKDLQVMKTLNVIQSEALVPNQIEEWLTQIIYLKEVTNIEIYFLNSLSGFYLLSGFQISSLKILQSNIVSIENNSFSGFSKLTSLTIETSSELEIKQGAFSNLKILQYLKLFSEIRFRLESGVFKHLSMLKKLNFQKKFWRKGEVLVLRKCIFQGLTNIKELLLENLGIHSLGEDMFLELENLEILHLKYNEISNLNEGAFRGLRKLQILELHNNKISILSVRAFLGLKNLQTIDLSGNNISVLPLCAFNGLQSISTLKLGGNKIKSIGVGVFGAICDDNFTVSCANLHAVSTFCNTSCALDKLKDLRLVSNEITFIHQHAFLGCNKLETLSLGHTNIHNLNFLYTPELSGFEIQNYNLNELANNTFRCSPMLSTVILSSMNIQIIHLKALEHLQNLKTIHLAKTNCDCSLHEIWQWLRSNKVQYKIKTDCNGVDYEVYLSGLECNYSVTQINQATKKTYTANDYAYFKLYIEPIIFIFIFLSGSFGNGLLLFIIFRHSDMRNKNNACVAHLAFADILSLILNLPLSYWDVVHIDWELGETTCKIFIASKDLAVSLLVFTVVTLTFERFLVVRSFKKLKSTYGSNGGPTIFLIFVWIYALVTSIPSYFNAIVHRRCFSSPPGSDDYVQRLHSFQLIMNCFLPVASIVLLNILTAITLKKSVREIPGQIRNQSRDESRNTVVNVVTILSVVFTLSYLPNFLLRALVSWSVWNIEDVFWYSFITYCLFFIHTIFSPFAVFVMGSKYKSHIEKYTRFFIRKEENIPATPDIKKATVNACNVLENLGKRIVLPEQEYDGQVPIFPDDIAAIDEAVRRERQERLNKLQARFM